MGVFAIRKNTSDINRQVSGQEKKNCFHAILTNVPKYNWTIKVVAGGLREGFTKVAKLIFFLNWHIFFYFFIIYLF